MAATKTNATKDKLARKTKTESKGKEKTETMVTGKKHYYFFGGGKAEGNASMKDLLGGKGAGLAEMSQCRHPGSARFHHHHRSLQALL